MTVPTISNLPTVPATSDPNFETEAPALFNHIKNTFVSEMNSAISFINSSTFDATVEFKNANFTAARNFLYMIDTSSGGISVTLPANPSTGDQLLLMDQKRTFATNNLTIVRNSQNINGAASDVVSKSTGALIRCIFQTSYGWTVDLYEGEWESGTSAGDLVYNGGNVGIGTTNPSCSLNVENSNDGHIAAFEGTGTNGGGRTISLGVGNNDVSELPTYQPYIYTNASDSANNSLALVSEGGTAATGGIDFYTGIVNDVEHRMRITRSGRVGIGTNSPTGKLDVNTGVMSGDIKIGNFDNVNNGTGSNTHLTQGTKLEFIADTNPRYSNHNTNTVAFVKAEYDGSDSTADVRTGNTALTFATHSGFADSGTLSEKMRISSFGNVGIGTSEPSAPLSVKKVSGTGTAFGVTDSSDTLLGSVYVDQSQGAVFVAADNSGTNKVFLSSYGDSYFKGGRVGIGTSSPGAKLEVESPSGAGNTNLLTLVRGGGYGQTTFNQFYNAGVSPNPTLWGLNFGLSATTDDDGKVGIKFESTTSGQTSSDKIYFKTANTNQMVIDSAGKVGIGTSEPGAELDLRGDLSNTAGGFQFGMGSSTASYFGVRLNTSGDVCFDTYGAPWTERMKIERTTGRVGIGTNSPSSPLHVKAANNIIMSLQSSDATVGNLYFNFLNDDGDEKGWIGYGSSTTDDFGIFNNEARDLNLGTSGATRLQIKSAGDVQISTGNLVIGTAGKGIDFSATSGTGTSELLDDYEEGTFTPTVSGTWTTNPTTLSGRYTKIGRMVYIQVEMTGGVKSSAISGYLTGLPIAVASSGTGSVTNVDVQDLGNCLFANTDRIWFTATNLGTAKIYITGQYIAS